jgi:hypothetical protein
MRSVPPRGVFPLSMKTLNLEVEGHFCPNVAAKGKSLTEFATQLTVDPFQQGGASQPLEGEPFQLVKCNRGLKVPNIRSQRTHEQFHPISQTK